MKNHLSQICKLLIRLLIFVQIDHFRYRSLFIHFTFANLQIYFSIFSYFSIELIFNPNFHDFGFVAKIGFQHATIFITFY